MEGKLDDLFLMFEAKGFLPIEIPGLVKDVLTIANKDEDTTINAVDQELEDLGWGIGVLDAQTYHLITHLKAHNEFPKIER